ncbi:MAG: hypothetical protein CSA42_01155 [Gammaproteobacteria bacterium]|nr:MAG: hypothetical protein CSA42_01155 [Gammaproteobacteria bacterium]
MKLKNIILINFIGLALLLGCNTDKKDNTKDENAIPPKIVAWLTLSEGDTNNQRLLAGVVTAAERTQLSFQAQGQVQTIHIKVGESFQKGQVLATLDKTNYRLQLQRAKAQLNTAIAQRNQAQTEVRRRQHLVKSKAVSRSQLDAFRLQLTSAQQSINAAKAQVKLAQKQLKDTDLIAPFSGTVTAKLAEIGQLVSPKVPVFLAEAKQTPEVAFSIPENMSRQVTIDQLVTVTLAALPDLALKGRITEISSQAQLGAFPAKLTLNKPPKTIKAGMTAEIHFDFHQINSNQNTGFHIPPSALGADENNKHFVYRIAKKDNQLQLVNVPVTVISLSGSDVLIQGDLSTNDKLVRSGLGFLHPEQAVLLMGEGTKQINP